jgi:hypothetical protein
MIEFNSVTAYSRVKTKYLCKEYCFSAMRLPALGLPPCSIFTREEIEQKTVSEHCHKFFETVSQNLCQ